MKILHIERKYHMLEIVFINTVRDHNVEIVFINTVRDWSLKKELPEGANSFL